MESVPTLNRGFTLAEMIVVLAIIGILAAVVINGQTSFDKALTITDTTYTVALSVRQAQTYGLSSRANSGFSNAGYGVHFGYPIPALKTYSLFADISHANYATALVPWCPLGTAGQPDAKPGNCLYDSGGSEIVQNFNFGRGFTISKICGKDMVSGTHCSTDFTPLTSLDVVFIRPNTTSVVSGIISGVPQQLRDAQIEISSPGGSVRAVCVTSVGEVSVAASIAACP